MCVFIVKTLLEKMRQRLFEKKMFIVTNFVDFYFHIIVPASTTPEINADRDKDQKDIRGKIQDTFSYRSTLKSF